MSRIQPPPSETDHGHHIIRQVELEYATAAAENARPGLLVPHREVVPIEVRAPLFELAAFLVPSVHPRLLWSARTNASEDPPVGVVLHVERREGLSDSVVVLQTHQRVDRHAFITLRDDPTATIALLQPIQIIDDFQDPAPFNENLTGARFERAYRGLLRLLQRQLVALLADPDAWRWKTGATPEDSPADDPYWHPDEMLKRVCRWRHDQKRTAKKMLVVDEVHRA